MRFKLFAVLLCLVASIAAVLALATHSMRADDEAKQEEAKKVPSAEPDAPPPERFVVPEGGVKELAAFLDGLRNFQAENLIEFQEFRKYGPAAMNSAAEKILALEKDTKSPAWKMANELLLIFRFQEIEELKPEQKQALVGDLNGHLSGKGSDLGPADLQLAMSAAQMLEHYGENKLGAEVYQTLGKAVAGLKDERYADLVDLCERSVRRLSLVGQPIKIEGTLLDGKKFNIESLKGKVVLVDFWATWCGPCREEFPNVREQYDKYKGRGFEVVGVSIDDNRLVVKDYVEQEGVPWITLHDLSEDGNPTADYYGINSIPCMILVGRDGKVISLRARGEELNRLLAEQFMQSDASSESGS